MAPQQEYMLSNIQFKSADPGLRFRNPFLALSIRGQLDVERFEAAVSVLVRRHSVLRAELDQTGRLSMRIRRVEEVNGFTFEDDCDDPTSVLAEEEWRRFDLTRAPLWRVKVIRIDLEEYIVSLSFCHLIWDGISMRTFLDLLAREYASYGCDKEPAQYEIFVNRAEQERMLRQAGSVQSLTESPGISRARHERRDGGIEVSEIDVRRYTVSIGREKMGKIRARAISSGTGPFVALLSAYMIAAASVFHRSSLVTAFATSRLDLRPAEDCLGYFSDLSVGVFLSDATAPGEARIQWVNRVPSWTEIQPSLGVTYPQEIWDFWARGPVFSGALEWPDLLPKLRTCVLDLTPSSRMLVSNGLHRRVFGGQIIPAFIVDDLLEGIVHLEYNATALNRRVVMKLADQLCAEVDS